MESFKLFAILVFDFMMAKGINSKCPYNFDKFSFCKGILLNHNIMIIT